jgi:hypothetical protein
VTVSIARLQSRHARDRERQGEADVVASRLALALDSIGWRSADGLESSEVAEIASHIVRECVSSHRDVSRAVAELAELLRAAAAMLDGGAMPAAMWVPAADELLSLYVSESF